MTPLRIPRQVALRTLSGFSMGCRIGLWAVKCARLARGDWPIRNLLFSLSALRASNHGIDAVWLNRNLRPSNRLAERIGVLVLRYGCRLPASLAGDFSWWAHGSDFTAHEKNVLAVTIVPLIALLRFALKSPSR